jgi:cell division protease FtsH
MVDYSMTRKESQKGPAQENAAGRRGGARRPLGGSSDPMEAIRRRPNLTLLYVMLAILGLVALHDLRVVYKTVEQIPYSHFEELLKQDKIKSVTVRGDTIEGELKEPEKGKSRFVTQRVDPTLAQQLESTGVEFSSVPKSTLLPTLLSWILPIGLFLAVWIFLTRRMAGKLGGGAGGLLSIGKSKARVYVESDTKVGFSDVAGVDEAKAELTEVVEFLKDPASHGRLGARMPKGILLVGSPGTGKTLLARAVAGEAGVPFFSISGSEFVEMFVGVGAARVRDLFEKARQHSPCIIFIDELDALGRARGPGPGGFGGHDEKEQTLNQLLVELDGFDPSSGIILLGATNRPEVLDPALLRAGRFDRQVLVDRPDKIGRVAILELHVKPIKLAPSVDLEQVAALTPGFTGADLANLVNEAALLATRRNADEVSLSDFTVAIERLIAGLEKRNRLLNPREREIVAHHEMGHALVAASQPGTDPVHKVSIIPRGVGALGYTLQRPTEDRFLMTREELEAKLAVLLGGRAAEWLCFGHLSTGASDDLAKATNIARSMVTQYAMVPELGNATFEDRNTSFLADGSAMFTGRNYSEETAREIDRAIIGIVDNSFERAKSVLALHKDTLVESAKALLEAETLDEKALEPYFQRMTTGSRRAIAR